MVTGEAFPCPHCGGRLEGVAKLWFGFNVGEDGQLEGFVDGISDEFTVNCSECPESYTLSGTPQWRQIGRYLAFLESQIGDI